MLRILELVVRLEPNLRDGVRWVRILELAVRFWGDIGVWPDMTPTPISKIRTLSVQRHIYSANLRSGSSGGERILEMSSKSTNVRAGSSLVES
jgi:hypothetical protein